MTKFILSASLVLGLACAGAAVDLVKDGKPVAEIVVPENPTPSVKTAADELQRHLEAMSGAKLAIVTNVSPEVSNQVYVGESEATRKLGVTLDDVKYDGFKIVALQNHVVLAGRDMYHIAHSFARFKDMPSKQRQPAWEAYTGRKWRFPPILDFNDGSKECGFHLWDGTGTLYAMFELLEQLGMRWYMPMQDIGTVIPKHKTISIKDQSIKREPEFPQRIMTDCAMGLFKPEFLWYKSLRVGTAFIMPVYHSLSGPLKLYPEEQPQEYYGKVNGKIDYFSPRLTSEKLRADLIAYLERVDQAFPDIQYTCIGQPDGWTSIDSADAAAGWDKLAERGMEGRFSDYYWDFILNIRERYMQKYPDKKFTVCAYGPTWQPPALIKAVPDNVAVMFAQCSPNWMLPKYNEQFDARNKWLALMNHKDQMIIWDYYLTHASTYNFPPVPAIFTRLMQRNFAGIYGRSVGTLVEVGWASSSERTKNQLGLGRPGLSHLMLYLHGRFCWDRNLDVQAVLNEYYDLFFGPAKKEMKAFYEFAEETWTRPEPRQITVAGGFLKPADVDKYFDILKRARAKTGDTIYGKRVDFIAAEMEPLKVLFEKLKRTGPTIHGFVPKESPQIDGDLDKPFWRAQAHTFNPLRNSITGDIPKHVGTSVSFRWLADNSALIVGIECLEPKMDKLLESCKDRDSMAIFNDDNIEIRLETAQGFRPFIVINPAGTVYDECVTVNVADLPLFYTVKPVAVKKYPDRWTVEVRIDAKPISGERPTDYFPWGVQVNRQRLAGNTPEHYMLSPSGTNFKDMKCMGNLIIRK